ncbi:MAG TPA: hypothetical protein VN326_15740 [Casimicrobiaceae bacterium]|jgi:hypothetical protein|nr:hypothetical protein [Casimicrobiaceae bacterium]
MSTTTRYFKFDQLQLRGPSAATVIKLMMACNDMALANEGIQWARDALIGKLKFKRQGALMYYSRLESSHLMEGFVVLESLLATPELSAAVARCDQEAQNSLALIKGYLPGGPKRAAFERIVVRVRHNLTFHYDKGGQLILRGIADRASRPVSNATSVTRGSSMHLWRWGIADDLIDTIVVRQIWQLPRDGDLEEDVNHIVDELQSIVLAFVDFSGEFIWCYLHA